MRDNDPQELKKKLEYFKNRIEQFPEDGFLWLEYGDFLHYEYNNHEMGVYAYEQANRLLKDKDMRVRLVNAYSWAGQLEKAVDIFEKSLREQPLPYVFCRLAEMYERHDKYDEAIQACHKALEIDPTYEEAYYFLGESTRRQSRTEAIGYYREAIKWEPDYQEAWASLGRELGSDESTRDEAIDALEKALELDLEDGWSHIFLAVTLWKKDEIERADYHYQKAVELLSEECPDVRRWYQEFLDSTQKDED